MRPRRSPRGSLDREHTPGRHPEVEVPRPARVPSHSLRAHAPQRRPGHGRFEGMDNCRFLRPFPRFMALGRRVLLVRSEERSRLGTAPQDNLACPQPNLDGLCQSPHVRGPRCMCRILIECENARISLLIGQSSQLPLVERYQSVFGESIIKSAVRILPQGVSMCITIILIS